MTRIVHVVQITIYRIGFGLVNMTILHFEDGGFNVRPNIQPPFYRDITEPRGRECETDSWGAVTAICWWYMWGMQSSPSPIPFKSPAAALVSACPPDSPPIIPTVTLPSAARLPFLRDGICLTRIDLLINTGLPGQHYQNNCRNLSQKVISCLLIMCRADLAVYRNRNLIHNHTQTRTKSEDCSVSWTL